MNIKQLKSLLKEAVREVVKEELPVLLLEHQIKLTKLNESISINNRSGLEVPYSSMESKKLMDLSFKNVQKAESAPPVIKNTIFDSLIADAAKNMKPGEVQSMMG
jgi:translation initiation factor 6 (eIF-6)